MCQRAGRSLEPVTYLKSRVHECKKKKEKGRKDRISKYFKVVTNAVLEL